MINIRDNCVQIDYTCDILLNIKKLNQFLELNDILLFLTFMCVKMYYFNYKTLLVIKKINTSNQLIFMVELLSFTINEVYINVCTLNK